MTLASKITLIRVAFIPIYMVFMYLSGGEIDMLIGEGRVYCSKSHGLCGWTDRAALQSGKRLW